MRKRGRGRERNRHGARMEGSPSQIGYAQCFFIISLFKIIVQKLAHAKHNIERNLTGQVISEGGEIFFRENKQASVRKWSSP